MRPEALHPLARHVEPLDGPPRVIREQRHVVPEPEQFTRKVEAVEPTVNDDCDLHAARVVSPPVPSIAASRSR